MAATTHYFSSRQSTGIHATLQHYSPIRPYPETWERYCVRLMLIIDNGSHLQSLQATSIPSTLYPLFHKMSVHIIYSTWKLCVSC